MDRTDKGLQAALETSELERRALTKVKRYVLTYVVVGQLFYQLCRTNIGFAQLTMGQDLGLKAEAFGFASGIFAFSAFLMQVPAGLLLEKFGARRWLTFNMAAWGLVVVAQAFVANGTQLAVLRFLLGVFEAGFLPGVFVLISIWFRRKDQGTATAFVQMGLGISALIGSPFAGWILDKTFLGLTGWRSLFLIEGALAFLWALAALRILNDDPATTAWLDGEERQFMLRFLGEDQARKAESGAIVTSSLSTVLKDPRVLTLLAAFALSGWVAGTFIFFNPMLLKRVNAGVSNQTVGLLALFPYALSAAAAYFWGRHADKTERHWHCVLPCLVAAAGMLLYPLARTPLVATVCLSIVQIGNGCFYCSFWPSCNLVVGRQAIAKATALFQAGNLLCSFTAPIFFGWMLDRTRSPELGLDTAAGTMLLIFLLMNVFFYRYKAQQRTLAAA
jgi:ACS family tartrate transporter-like MFS transporter